MNKPNYVAKHSAWSAVTFWRVILFFLIVPLVIMIADIIIKKHDIIEFYDDCVIHKRGVFSKSEKRSAFTGVAGVSINQTFMQRILGYGDVKVDVLGRWDIDTNGIVNPKALQEYLETKFVKVGQVNNIMAN